MYWTGSAYGFWLRITELIMNTNTVQRYSYTLYDCGLYVSLMHAMCTVTSAIHQCIPIGITNNKLYTSVLKWYILSNYTPLLYRAHVQVLPRFAKAKHV